MSWFTEPATSEKAELVALCSLSLSASLLPSCGLSLSQSLLPGNKLGGGISLTGWGVGVVAGPLFAGLLPCFCWEAFLSSSPTAVPVWASVSVLTPTPDPSCSPGPTPAPAMPPPSGCCMIKSSNDSSGLLSQASIPWVLGPPYHCCLCLASSLRALPWLPGCLSGSLSPKLSVFPSITAGC